jgi:hypothetical protein
MIAGMTKRTFRSLMGRPSTMNMQQASAVLHRVANGESLLAISRDPDMPGESTIRSWASVHAWFGDALKVAEREGARAMVEQALEIADGTQHAKHVAEVYSAQLRTNMRKWLAAKRDPERYGEKMPATTSGGAQVVIYMPGKETDEEYEARIRRQRLEAEHIRMIEGRARALEDQSSD